MSQENIVNTLLDLGLTRIEAKVFIQLSKNGALRARDIGSSLKISKQQLYPALKNLQNKGIVNSSIERPAKFSSLPFSQALDLLTQTKIKEATSIQHNKDSLLKDWQAIVVNEIRDTSARFSVIEGRKCVYSKIQQMIQESEKQLCMVCSLPTLIRTYEFGVLEPIFNHPQKSIGQFRFITEATEQSFTTTKALMQKNSQNSFNLKCRNPEMGLQLSPRMVIRDNKELLFFTSLNKDDNSSLWTNCEELVQSFSVVFEDLWRNSEDIEKGFNTKRAKNGQRLEKSPEIRKKFEKIINSAKKEVICLTSAERLPLLLKKMSAPCMKKVSIRIMAPITRKNYEIMKTSGDIQVKHVPPTCIETFIIDKTHLFQFKLPPNQRDFKSSVPFDPFYSKDEQDVRKTRKRLDDLWIYACNPSVSSLEELMEKIGYTPSSSFPPMRRVKGYTVFTDEPEAVYAEDFLKKTVSVIQTSSKDLIEKGRVFSISASGIIRAPKYLDLPDMMVWIDHIQKGSCFGQGDAVVVYLLLESDNRLSFVPAGGIGDNQQGVAFRRENQFPEKVTSEYYKLVAKDEIQVRVHGNKLFAGWTVPILLFPSYKLPPACILIEGYGEVKSRASTIISPTGARTETQAKYMDAFVTFMHPASRYSGPGTDGLFFRDSVFYVGLK
jgi:sugar-specific transcriptional regulator TrmB